MRSASAEVLKRETPAEKDLQGKPTEQLSDQPQTQHQSQIWMKRRVFAMSANKK